MGSMRVVGRWAVWTVVLALLYQVLEDSPVRDEMIAGAALAALAAFTAVRLRALSVVTYAPRWLELWHLHSVPLKMVRETGAVAWCIVRSLIGPSLLKGEVGVLPFDFGGAKNPDDALRRALSTYGICLSPDAVVCLMDEGTLIVHRLVGRTDPASSDRRWPV
jgi:hypothetical protein